MMDSFQYEKDRKSWIIWLPITALCIG